MKIVPWVMWLVVFIVIWAGLMAGLLISLSGCSNSSYFRSLDVDRQVYRWAKTCAGCTCVELADKARDVHESLGYTVERGTSSNGDKRHAFLKIYEGDRFIRDSMNHASFTEECGSEFTRQYKRWDGKSPIKGGCDGLSV